MVASTSKLASDLREALGELGGKKTNSAVNLGIDFKAGRRRDRPDPRTKRRKDSEEANLGKQRWLS